jgi:hypothetical protein
MWTTRQALEARYREEVEALAAEIKQCEAVLATIETQRARHESSLLAADLRVKERQVGGSEGINLTTQGTFAFPGTISERRLNPLRR